MPIQFLPENYFLPDFDDCTIHHMFEIMTGAKAALKKDKLCQYELPQFKEFTLDALVTQCKMDM